MEDIPWSMTMVKPRSGTATALMKAGAGQVVVQSSATGEKPQPSPLARMALERGRSFRVGLEGWGTGPSNLDQIERAKEIIGAVGRPIATGDAWKELRHGINKGLYELKAGAKKAL
jgi:uncharacterized protein (DUF849 family)